MKRQLHKQKDRKEKQKTSKRKGKISSLSDEPIDFSDSAKVQAYRTKVRKRIC